MRDFRNLIHKVIWKLFVIIVFSFDILNCKPNKLSDSTVTKNDSIQKKWQVGIRLDINAVKETVLLDPEYYPVYLTRIKIYFDHQVPPVGIYIPVKYV